MNPIKSINICNNDGRTKAIKTFKRFKFMQLKVTVSFYVGLNAFLRFNTAENHNNLQ